MKLAIAAIGLLKTGAEKELAEDYETRIRGLCKKAGFTALLHHEWAESRLAAAGARNAEEAKHLWSAVPGGTPVVALDERGEAMPSEAFARFLAREAMTGARQLSFLIGGPDGHSPETRTKATKLLAFGPMTWPHRLVRVMLLEQIYRAVTILVNHPYHRN
jgi:23S rRNA (pseudouridine1915-N3)-methyltransferase